MSYGSLRPRLIAGGLIVFVAGILTVAGFTLATSSFETPPPAPAREPLRVKRSQVIAYTPGSGEAVLRCDGCSGTGFSTLNPLGERRRCQFCQGRGAFRVALSNGLEIVPD